MAVVFSDDFNRGSLGANWTPYFSTWSITSNQLTITASAPNPVEYSGTGSVLADCDVSVAHYSTASNPGGLTARRASATDTYYALRFYSDGGWDLVRTVAGTPTAIADDGGSKVTLVAGNRMRLVVTGTGATVSLKVYYNGVQQGSTISDTDAARITVAGYTGVFGFANNTLFDDFSLDDTSAGAAVAIPQGAAALAGRGVSMGFAINMPSES